MRSAAVLALFLWVAPTAAGAQALTPDKRAAREFVEGQRAYEARDYRHAAESFEAAYAAKPHYDSLWNAARSWQRAGEDLRAANLLERYLREAPADAADRDEATGVLARLDKVVGRLELHVSGVTDVALDGAPVEPAARYVAPGDHVATARVRGSPAVVVRRAFSVRAGEVVSVTLAPPEAPREPARAPLDREERRRPLPPWTLAIGGALAATGTALTIVWGLDTLKKRDAFLADETAPNLDAGNAAETRTNIALAATVGVVVVSVAVALVLVDWRRGDAKRALGSRPFMIAF